MATSLFTIKWYSQCMVYSKLLLLLLFLIACDRPVARQNLEKHTSYRSMMKYDMRQPDEAFVLPDKMAEISALTLHGDHELLFLNDEQGKVFRFDKHTGKTTEQLKFWKNGDFEGIEMVGNRVYTLQSDGDLISFELLEGEVRNIRKEETSLSNKNDTEGLGYDPINDVLLIACKQDGDIGDNRVQGRVVYAYDHHNRRLNEDPVIQVRWESVRDFLKLHGLDIFINDSRRFKPSAIAVHPIDKHYYVLSTTGKSIIVFDRKGEIVLYYTVPRNIMEQPEGICFDTNGDMYISSEGDEGSPRIAKFKIKAQ